MLMITCPLHALTMMNGCEHRNTNGSAAMEIDIQVCTVNCVFAHIMPITMIEIMNNVNHGNLRVTVDKMRQPVMTPGISEVWPAHTLLSGQSIARCGSLLIGTDHCIV